MTNEQQHALWEYQRVIQEQKLALTSLCITDSHKKAIVADIAVKLASYNKLMGVKS